jgi:Tfp pilus assembly protein PilE
VFCLWLIIFIYLGSQSCGNSYGSCIGDKSKPLENHVVVIIIICVVTLIFISGCSCYYRAYRRKQARAQLAQQIQVLTAQTQPPYIYYVNPNPPVTITSPIQEELPPTYEQSERQKVGIWMRIAHTITSNWEMKLYRNCTIRKLFQ